MKKADIFKKVKEIDETIEGRFFHECQDADEWKSHYEILLARISEITKEILGKQ